MRLNAILSINVLAIFFLCDAGVLYAYTNNNFCDSLSMLMVSPQNECIYTDFTLNGNMSEFGTSCYSDEPDTLFKVVVPENGQFLVKASQTVLSLYSACSDDNIACEPVFSSKLISNLTPNDTLIVRFTPLFTYSTPQYQVCFSEANPSNNNTCANAIPIEVGQNGNCETVNIDLRYNDFNNPNSCVSSSSNVDAYYEYTVPTSSLVELTTENYLLNYTGFNACDGELLFCFTDVRQALLPITEPGTTIVLQVSSNSRIEDSFCIKEVSPSTNNSCANAMLIEVGQNGNCDTINIDFKYNSFNNLNSCVSSSYNVDAFYEYTVPPSGLVELTVENYQLNYTGYNACGGEQLFCFTNVSHVLLPVAEPGTAIILQVSSSNRIEYSFCIAEVSPSTNNSCANAITLELGQNGNCDTVDVDLRYNDFNTPNSCMSFSTSADAFYEYTVPPIGLVGIITEYYGIKFTGYTACDGAELFCTSERQALLPVAEPGTIIILQVSGNLSEYSFCIAEVFPSTNNSCANAITLELGQNGNCDTVDVDLRYNDFNTPNSCMSFSTSADAFYEYTVPPIGLVGIITEYYGIKFTGYTACDGAELFCTSERQALLPVAEPGTIIILQVSGNLSEYSFCIFEVSLSTNNICANAIPIEIGQNGSCDTVDIDLRYNDFNNPNSCVSSNSNVDAFYEYVVPSSGFVGVTTENYHVNYTGYNVCEGAELFCFTNVRRALLSGAEPGTTIILQVSSDSRIEERICFTEVSPSPNNSCENAIPIEVGQNGNCDTVGIDLRYNDFNNPNSCVSSNSNNVDAFYKFTAPTSGLVEITTENYVFNFTGYNVCNGEELFCITRARRALLPQTEPGTAIILQVSSNSRIEDSFCITEVSASTNNTCANAMPIEVGQNGNCDTIDIDLRYNDFDTPNSCVSATVDAFYEYIVPPSGLVEITNGSSRINFTGYNACDGAELFCFTNVRQILLPIAESGTTIILQVSSSYRSEYSFCIAEVSPSVNNICADAILIEVGQNGDCNTVDIDLRYNDFNNPNSCLYSNTIVDAFYEYIVPPSGLVELTTVGSFFYNALRINYTGYNACNGAELFCFTNAYQVLLPIAEPGTTIILQVSDSRDDYSFCITEVSPSTNNSCENAIPIGVGQNENCNTVNIDLRYNDFNNPNSCFLANVDAFYEYTVPSSGLVEITTRSSFVNFTGYNACNDAELFCFTGVSQVLLPIAEPGTNIILQISSRNRSESSFCIAEVSPSTNNICANAIPIELGQNENCNTVDIDLRYNDFNNPNSCVSSNNSEADAFYEYTVPPSGLVGITGSSRISYTGYNACDGGELFCFTDLSLVLLPVAEPGTTIILQVSSASRDEFSFCIAEVSPSPNNSCTNAIPIELGQNENCNTIDVDLRYNDFSNPNSCVSSNTTVDAFYEYIVPSSGLVEITTRSSRVTYTGYNACGGVQLICTDQSQALLPMIEPGTTIILQVSSTSRSKFSFCIAEVFSSPNNVCANAIPIELGQDGNCNSIDIDLTYNDFNNPNSCVSSNYNVDAFYEYTVPSSGLVEITGSSQMNFTGYNTCDGEELFCFRYADQVLLPIAEPGTTVILQVSDDRGEHSFCIAEVFPSPNNVCANAIPIELGQNGNCNSIDIDLTYNDLDNPNSCVLSFSDEVDAFFEYTVPPSGLVEITGSSRINFTGYNACDGAELFCFTRVSQVLLPVAEPGTNVILQISESRSEYSFCIAEVSPSNNNTCINAIPIELGQNGNCNTVEVDLRYNNFDNPNSCVESNSNNVDAFYEYTVPPNGLVGVTTGSFGINFTGYKACDGEQLFCTSVRQALLPWAEPGTTIILQVSSNSRIEFSFCTAEVSPSVNNICANAIPIEIGQNGNCNTEDIDLRYNDFNFPNSCVSSNSNMVDAFYEYIVPPSGLVEITSENYSINYTGYNACDGEQLFCFTRVRQALLPVAEPGTSIILQVSSNSRIEDSICFTEVSPSPNNSCENATLIDIGLNGNCNTINIDLEYNDFNNLNSCVSSNYNVDAFYEYTVPSSGLVEITNGSSRINFTGYNACDGAELFCFTRVRQALLPIAEPGSTIILQISSESRDEVSFCIEEILPTANNSCGNATPIEVGQNANCNTINLRYNDLNNPNFCVSSYNNVDAFYEYTVPPSGLVKITTRSSYINFTGYNTCDGEILFCFTGSVRRVLLPNTEPGTTIILQISSENDSEVSFCIEEVLPSPNNSCENATWISIEEDENCLNNVTLNLEDNNLNLPVICADNEIADAFYKFIVPPSGQITLADVNNFFDEFSIQIFETCTTESIFCNKDFDSNDFVPGLTPGDTLILQLFDNIERVTEFCVYNAQPSSNNHCVDATLVTVGTASSCSTNSIIIDFTFNNEDIETDCNFYSDLNRDAFVEYVSPESGYVKMSFNNITINNSELEAQISQYCNPASFECLPVLKNNIFPFQKPGTNTIVQLVYQNNEPLELCLIEAHPTENNLCENAELIAVHPSSDSCNFISIDFNDNTLDKQNSDCTTYSFSSKVDAFYNFVVPPSGQIKINSIDNFGFAVFNRCIDYNSIYCESTSLKGDLIANLPSGDTLLMQIYSNFENEINFCLREEPCEVSNYVEDILFVEVFEPDSCILTTVSSATATEQAYSFIVPGSGQIRIKPSSNRIGAELYDKCSFNSLFYARPLMPNTVIKNLFPGDTIFLILYSSNLGDTFCIESAPPSDNDLCNNPTEIEIAQEGGCSDYQIEMNALSNNGDLGVCGNNLIDAYFEFTAPQNGYIKAKISDEHFFSVLNNCSNEKPVFCNNGNGNEFVVSNLTPFENYIIKVADDNLQTFTICLEEIEPIENDFCANAAPIEVTISIDECESNIISIDLSNNSLENSVSCQPDGFVVDAYYTFVAPPSGQVVFNNIFNAALMVYESCGGQQLYCEDNNFGTKPARNLIPGESYILQIAGKRNRTYEFCLSDATPSPNNLCGTALSLNIGSEESCFVNEVRINTNYNTRNYSNGCSSEKDAFFSFTAPENGSVKFITNIDVDFGVLNSCGENFLQCFQEKRKLVVIDLIPSQTYILVIFNNSFISNLTICASEAFTSTNNTCNNAILIDVNDQDNCTGNLTLVENYDNTLGRSEDCIQFQDIKADAFYKFVVPPSGQVFINTFGRANAGFSIFKSCNNYVQIFTCISTDNNFFEETSELVNNLPIGDTLYLQLFQNEPSNFNFCIEESLPPENNTCENAQWMFKDENGTCSFTQFNVNLFLHTLQSPPPSNSCYNSPNVDAFYKMIVPTEGAISIESNEAFSLAIYENCNDMLLYCSNALKEHRYAGSMPGDTIILQILDDRTTSSFNVCISTLTPSENNTCATSTLLDIQTEITCTEVNSTLVDLSENTLDIDPVCARNNSYIITDAFYGFIVPESGQIKVNRLDSSTWFGVAIYNNCNSNSLYCDNFHSTDSEPITNLTPGDTLILQIFGSVGEFLSICVSNASPSENNTCAGAIPLTVGTEEACANNEISVTTIYNDQNFSNGCRSGEDVFYSFTMPQSGHIKIKTNIRIHAYAILDECYGNVLVCEEQFNNEFITPYLSPGENYILQLIDIPQFYYTPADLSVCLIEAILPNNNDCANAIPVDVTEPYNYHYTEASLNFATLNLTPNCSYPTADIYYQFTAPKSGAVRLYTNNSSIGATIFSGCGSDEIFCRRNLNSVNLVRDLVPDSIYQIQFFSYSLDDFEFCIEDVKATLNNTCENATLINLQETNVCPLFSSYSDISINTLDKLFCDGLYYNDRYVDVFFKIIVPESGQFNIEVDEVLYLALYENCSSEAFYCESVFSSNPDIFTSNPGDTIICQLIGSKYEGTNSICVEDAQQVAQPDENYDCSNAEWIEVGEFTNCSTNEVTGFLFNNLLDSEVLCNNTWYDYGLFYQFVVPPSGFIAVSGWVRYGEYRDNRIPFALYQNCEDPYFYCNSAGRGVKLIDLEPADTIVIQILGNSDSNSNAFALCIEEAPEIVNDTCNENLPFANVSDTVGYHIKNSIDFTYYTLSDSIFCTWLSSPKDAFYNIIVPPGGRFKFLGATDNDNYSIEIYDKCNSELLWCLENAFNSINEDQFNAGDTLILRVLSYEIDLEFCIEANPSTPNNDCVDASFIDVLPLNACEDENFTQIILQNNTSDGMELCNDHFSIRDAFYKLRVPQNGAIYMETANVEYVSLYASCDSLIAVNCNMQFNDCVLFQNLPANDTIILEVSGIRWNNLRFCISETENAPNNFCNSAIELPVLDINECFSNFTIQDKYVNTLQLEPECEGNINSDVYFKFVAPDDGSIRMLFENASFSGIAIYESCFGIPIFCSSFNDRFDVNNLPANDTLILQVFSRQITSLFDICIADNSRVANDVCDRPTNLNVYANSNCEDNLFTGDFGDYNFTQQMSCRSSNSPDAYFQFVVPESGGVRLISKSTISTAVYDGCNSLEIFCDDNANDEIIRNLSVGDTLILMVKSRFDDEEDFRICLQELETPANDVCDQAKLTTVLPFNNCIINNAQPVSFNFNNLDIQPSCAENTLVDAFFQFKVPASGQVRISNFDNYTNVYIAVYDACDGTELFCNSNEAIIKNLPVGENVILQLSVNEAYNTSFCIEEIPMSENNSCENAMPIIISSADLNCEDYLKEINPAFNAITQMPACYDGEEPLLADLFFEFYVPENGKIRVTTSELIGLSIYDTCNGTSIFCKDDISNNVIENLPPNETLIIQTYHYADSKTTICISEVNQSGSNLCENASLLNVPLIANGNLFEHFAENILLNNTVERMPYCLNTAAADIYYQAVVPSSGKLFVYIPANEFLSDKVGLSIYSNCGDEELFCNDDFVNEIIEGLPSDETIILQFYQENPVNHDFLVLDGGAFANNNCSGAQFIEMNNNENCNDNQFIINYEFYTLSRQMYCFDQSRNYVDAFFEIVVPESGRFLLQSDTSVGVILLENCNEDIIYCSDFFSSSFEFDNLPTNDTLILQIILDRTKASFCLSNDVPSSNNNCGNAVAVSVNKNKDCDSLIIVPNATNTIEEASSCSPAVADLYYQIDLSNIEGLFIDVINNTSNVGAVFYDSCGGNELLCIENISNEIVDNLPDNVIMRLTQGSPGNFDLCLNGTSSIPINDNCIEATNLCGEIVYAINERATINEIGINANCDINLNKSLWYQFTTNASGNDVLVEIQQEECSTENNSPNLNAFISRQPCVENYEVVEDCITYMIEEKRYELILENPEPNTNYLVFVGSRSSNISCNFTISAIGNIYNCGAQPCQAKISGKIIGKDDCNISDIEVIIKNENDEILETLTTDEEGNYITEIEHKCTSYTIELNESTLPSCYNGNSEPISFNLNDDNILDGVDFIDEACTPPNAGKFNCDE